MEYFGNPLQEKKTTVSFEDNNDQSDYFEPQKRQPMTFLPQDGNMTYDDDDNVSEISVSSEIEKERAMQMVFGTVFDQDHPQRI